MKKLCMLFTLLLLLAGCNKAPDIILKVVVDNNGETEYYSVYEFGNLGDTSKFTSDEISVYHTKDNSFISEKMDKNYLNFFTVEKLYDSNNKAIKVTDEELDVLKKVAQEVTNPIVNASVVIDDGDYYALVTVKANKTTRDEFYSYNKESTKLTYLCVWEHATIIGLKKNIHES